MASGKLHEDTKTPPLIQGFRASFMPEKACFFARKNIH
jgi:hypothetical protein